MLSSKADSFEKKRKESNDFRSSSIQKPRSTLCDLLYIYRFSLESQELGKQKYHQLISARSGHQVSIEIN